MKHTLDKFLSLTKDVGGVVQMNVPDPFTGTGVEFRWHGVIEGREANSSVRVDSVKLEDPEWLDNTIDQFVHQIRRAAGFWKTPKPDMYIQKRPDGKFEPGPEGVKTDYRISGLCGAHKNESQVLPPIVSPGIHRGPVSG